MPVRVGIVDDGLVPSADPSLPVSHGAAVARVILSLAPQAELFDAPSFAGSRQADAAAVARGLETCIGAGVRVVNLSFGLREDVASLRSACVNAIGQGAILVAARPARGPAVFPAAYPGVIAATGDARCAHDAWSALDGGGLFGAAPASPVASIPGGASFAAARLSAFAANFLLETPAATAVEFRGWLMQHASYLGRERH